MTLARDECTPNRCLCGCCQGLTASTPVAVFNRTGLAAIAYRVGTQPLFKRSMLAALARDPVLAGLGTRADDDFSIALLDAWATVGDVLTFYGERIANESYLPTASERFSLLEMARLIGYELRPGVAASGFVAFTIESGPGSPAEVTLEPGIKVQSVPGPGEKPQTYETGTPLTARLAWNALTPRLTAPQELDLTTRQLYLEGTSTQLQPGDAILIIGDERTGFAGAEEWDFRILERVEPEADADRTLIAWSPALGTTTPATVFPSQDGTQLYALRQRAALFGHNAPDTRLLNFRGTNLSQIANRDGTWKNFNLDVDPATNAIAIDLDTVYPKIVVGSWIVLVSPTYSEVSRVAGATTASRADFALSGKVTRIVPDALENTNQFGLRTTTVFAQSEELAILERPVREPVYGTTLTLGQLAPDLVPGQPLAFSGKRLRLRIAVSANGLEIESGAVQVEVFPGDILQVLAPPVRKTAGGNIPISPMELVAELDAPTGMDLIWQIKDGNGFTGVLEASSADVELARADAQGDPEISEIAFIDSALDAVSLDDGLTAIRLSAALRGCFDRESVRINANVAPVTHGETVRETLGSGNASQTYQRFTLQQPPLTHVPVGAGSGALSTLALRVNDLLWEEVPSLYGHGPRDRVYVTRPLDDGKTVVEFGDGITGARVPTGRENVRATYRKGIGLAGQVKAGQLSQLMSAPLGVKSAINPEATGGSDDPEALADARENAPLTVLTLDRAVSLRDYEDFTRALSGIAKTLASWVWDGRARRVLLTVAGPNGAEITETGATFSSLVGALRGAGDPFVGFTVKSFRKATFHLMARLKVDEPTYERAAVHAAVETALRDRFSFTARAFAQPVALSEVVAVIQEVAGVIAVDVEELYRGPTPDLQPRLPADRPHVDASGVLQAAELLTLDPAPLALEVMP